MKQRIRHWLSISLAFAMVLSLLPVSAMAVSLEYDVGQNDVEIVDHNGAECPGHIIRGTSSSGLTWEQHKITVNGGTHKIILDNVNVNPRWPLEQSAMDITGGANVTLVLQGNNTLNGRSNHPGIWVEAGSSLTIEGDGSLYAAALGGTAGMGAAGIGSSYGTNTNFGDITIKSGTVEAYGTVGGAGIGGGYELGSGTATGNITITGGWVKAIGGSILGESSAGSGIGAGENANYGGTITISGGVVYAQSGKDDMPSIGGGGHITGGVSHGTFSTNKPDGSKGNAVIVAPNGIGANQNAAEWDGIFCSYGSDENTATVSNGTVVLSGGNANIQVWGDPELNYNLTVQNGADLRIVANNRNNASATLTMGAGYMLTNNSTITLGTGDADTSYLILKGGVEKTDGSGTLNVSNLAAVKLPLTEDLVTLDPESPTKYSGKVQNPNVTVKLENLWGYDQDFYNPADYTKSVPSGEIKNANTYEITLVATGTGNLLSGQDVEISYIINPADLTVTMPKSWTVWKDEPNPVDTLPTTPAGLESKSAAAYIGEIDDGTITWYSNKDCTELLKNEDTVFENSGSVYWKYTHGNGNFESGQTGSMLIQISDTQPPHVKITGGAATKTYGDSAFGLTAVLETQEGKTVEIQSGVTWTSSNPEVATVTGTNKTAMVNITGAGSTIITATVDAYQGSGNGDEYPSVTGTFVLTVNPKTITVDESALILNNQPASSGSYTWSYDGKKTVTAAGAQLSEDGIVVGDIGKVSLDASAVLDNTNVGDRQAAVTYTLSGARAEHYVLNPKTSTKTVIITQAESSNNNVTSTPGTLTITNDVKKTYFFYLNALDPKATFGQLGSVSYSNPVVQISEGNAYKDHISAKITGNTLIVTVDQVDTTVSSVGTIQVAISSTNFKPAIGTITLEAENLDQGHSTGDITIKNKLSGNNTNTNDVFQYTIQLEYEPLAGGDPTPFTAPVAYRGTGSVQNHNNDGTVTPNNKGVIFFTLNGGQELTFSGNLDQAHKVNYTITQIDSLGYTTAVTKATDFNETPQLIGNPATGYLHCQHENPSSGVENNDWAEIVYTNTKNSGTDPGTRDDYTLHYVTNGGKHLSSETKSSSWTKDYEDLPIPVRDGYTFEGWYWDLRLTEPVTGDVKVNKTTVTLYAKWSGGNYGPDDTGVSKWLETDEHNAFLSGYPDGSFLADKNMTRAEVAQMFYSLLLDKNVTITKTFSDVEDDAWYAKAVNTMASLGMLEGYPDGTFRPDAPITRAEFAAIALAFAYDPASASCSYTDVSANAWYYTYVAQATTYGWIGGYPDGSFRPNNSITRAEVAVIVNNMLGRDADESYINRNADELVSFVDLSKNHWAYYTIMEATNTHDYTTSSNGESWK